MQHALGGEVVQRRGDVQPERQQLLEGERAVRLQQLRERRPLEVLEQEVREAPVRRRAEPAHHDRVGQPGEQVRLVAQVGERRRRARLVGPQHLRHQHGQPVLVPHEQRLVAAPAADPPQQRPPGRQLVALPQAPGRPRTAGKGAATVDSLVVEERGLGAQRRHGVLARRLDRVPAERPAERQHGRRDRGREHARQRALIAARGRRRRARGTRGRGGLTSRGPSASGRVLPSRVTPAIRIHVDATT